MTAFEHIEDLIQVSFLCEKSCDVKPVSQGIRKTADEKKICPEGLTQKES